MGSLCCRVKHIKAQDALTCARVASTLKHFPDIPTPLCPVPLAVLAPHPKGHLRYSRASAIMSLLCAPVLVTHPHILPVSFLCVLGLFSYELESLPGEPGGAGLCSHPHEEKTPPYILMRTVTYSRLWLHFIGV